MSIALLHRLPANAPKRIESSAPASTPASVWPRLADYKLEESGGCQSPSPFRSAAFELRFPGQRALESVGLGNIRDPFLTSEQFAESTTNSRSRRWALRRAVGVVPIPNLDSAFISPFTPVPTSVVVNPLQREMLAGLCYLAKTHQDRKDGFLVGDVVACTEPQITCISRISERQALLALARRFPRLISQRGSLNDENNPVRFIPSRVACEDYRLGALDGAKTKSLLALETASRK